MKQTTESSQLDKRLAIIIVHYRTPALVIDCLSSLIEAVDAKQDIILVVDNDSGAQSLNKITEWIERNPLRALIEVHATGWNGGFSYGNNRGIKEVAAQYYLLLNSDTQVSPDSLELMLKTMNKNAALGMVGPRLVSEEIQPQVSAFNNITPLSELVRAASTRPISWIFKKHVAPVHQFDDWSSPDWISFACVMIRKEVFQDIGLLDEEFFMYYEDIDFCRRARNAGWDILYYPAADVVHWESGSSALNSSTSKRKRRPGYFYESRSRYFKKYYGLSGLLTANLCWSIGRLIAYSRELFGNKIAHACEKEFWDIWKGALSSRMIKPNSSPRST